MSKRIHNLRSSESEALILETYNNKEYQFYTDNLNVSPMCLQLITCN